MLRSGIYSYLFVIYSVDKLNKFKATDGCSSPILYFFFFFLFYYILVVGVREGAARDAHPE